jgi:hypothetical protein
MNRMIAVILMLEAAIPAASCHQTARTQESKPSKTEHRLL